MNKIKKTTLLAVAGLGLVSQAHAQFQNGDLVLGFTEAGKANEYIVELGNFQTVVGVGGSSVMDLSSHFNQSSFNGAFSTLSGANMGVVGGSKLFAASFVYETALRTGGAGVPSVPGSTAPPQLAHAAGQNGLSAVVAMLASGTALGLSAGNDLVTPRGGAGSANASWFNNVESATPPSSSFFSATGYQPDQTASSSIIYEDLWGTPTTTASGAYNFNYMGYFTLDMSGANASLTFTPSAAVVPEPTTYGAIAGAGLLLLCLRRQFTRKSA
jgi:hypothetical protein